MICTRALSAPADASTRISNTSSPWAGVTLTAHCSKNVRIAARCTSSTWAITSSRLSAQPATEPAAIAARSPLRPPVFGTTALFAFLMILWLTVSSNCCGSAPNVSRASAPAYAIAIGSVHPIAGTSSSARISSYARHVCTLHPILSPPFAASKRTALVYPRRPPLFCAVMDSTALLPFSSLPPDIQRGLYRKAPAPR